MEKNGIFNAAPFFNKFWNTKAWREWIIFNGVYSRNNLPEKIEDGAYVINLDKYADVGMHWITQKWHCLFW